jgi:two-component system, OmpR family, sensor histidine kinase YxdK
MGMNEIKIAELNRVKLILSYASMFTLFFSILYSLLLIISYIYNASNNQVKNLFPVYLAVIIPILFTISYILNLKNKYILSKGVLISTILALNFIAGIWWGFDLPSILLSYIFCIIILALTSKTKECIFYLTVLITSIFIGNILRNYLEIKTSWYGSGFYINDIIEFSVIFIFITFILIKFNQEQNKTLTRALRVENILKQERDNLEILVIEKTKEIKQIQMEEISKMYHLIEFGKLSSGLYHDLITPIQTMNLYIDKLSEKNLIRDNRFSKIILNIKNTHNKLSLMLQNIRKQISLKIDNEEFNLINEISDLVNLIKNNYLKDEIEIIFSVDKIQIINSKKYLLNHIVLNLISNAHEACLQDKKVNNKNKYKIKIDIGKYNNKNYISIVDNGIGIEKNNLIKIFNEFYSSKNKQNCGIGLSSSKYFLEKYLSGRIFVESEYNIGTTMTIIF